jgi:hypothetical protein
MGIASLITGIVSIVLCFVLAFIYASPIALVPAIAGVILGSIARKKSRDEKKDDGIATAGFIISIASAGIIALVSISCYGCLYCAHKVSKSVSESDYLKRMQNLQNDPEYRKNQEDTRKVFDDVVNALKDGNKKH